MHHFKYKKNRLFCENVPIHKIARDVGTPLYCYSYATILHHITAFKKACAGLKHLICFSMKSNSNQAVLKILVKNGAGIDVVSGGELHRALRAGASPPKIIFSGVGKTEEEIRLALKKEILLINVESEEELKLLSSTARRLNKKPRISLRVNPDISPRTHPYLATALKESKFGIPMRDAPRLYSYTKRDKNLIPIGVSCHIGSQITKLRPFKDCLCRVTSFVKGLKEDGFDIQYLDLGGGLGIPYKGEHTPNMSAYVGVLRGELKKIGCTIIFEPGRVIVGNAGILVTKVLYNKRQGKKRFIIVDAAMNDLIRPTLYGSFHDIWPEKKANKKGARYDMVGPICESGDFFAQGRLLPHFKTGELAAIMSAGAYGFTMASNYNSRPRGTEVLVKENRYAVVRKRENYNDLTRGEKTPRYLL